MKPETTDPEARVERGFTGVVLLYDERGWQSRRTVPARPTDTEADLIAAAAERGVVTIRNMIDLFNDHNDFLCSTCDEDFNWENRQRVQELDLRFFGVEWDPTIRL